MSEWPTSLIELQQINPVNKIWELTELCFSTPLKVILTVVVIFTGCFSHHFASKKMMLSHEDRTQNWRQYGT